LVEIVPRATILELPRVASIILAINVVIGIAVHAWERGATYVLLLAAAALQIAFVAAIEIALRGV
jgi:hypothetical protein